MSKKTLENCSLIKKACDKLGIGKPEQYDGKCEGYASHDRDEPTLKCRECNLNIGYEE